MVRVAFRRVEDVEVDVEVHVLDTAAHRVERRPDRLDGAVRRDDLERRAVEPSLLAVVDVPDADEDEQGRLDISPLQVVEPNGAVEAIGPALDAVRGRVEDVYLHVDLDVLDPSEGHANEYAAPGGLSADAVEQVVSAVTSRLTVRAAALTAYDPAADADGSIPPIANRLLTRIAAEAPVAARVS